MAGHAGSTNRNEKFHFGVQVKDKRGNFIKTIDPRTKKPTNTWHAFIAQDKKDLFALAHKWYAEENEIVETK